MQKREFVKLYINLKYNNMHCQMWKLLDYLKIKHVNNQCFKIIVVRIN